MTTITTGSPAVASARDGMTARRAVAAASDHPSAPAWRPPAWCPEDDTRDNVVARRNVLFGLWAGRAMGLSGPDLTAYMAEAHFADFAVPGDADIVAKVEADLRRSGLAVGLSDLRARLAACHGEALRQTRVTD